MKAPEIWAIVATDGYVEEFRDNQEDAECVGLESDSLSPKYAPHSVVRYTPAPEWRKFDQENPPEIGWYQCEYRNAVDGRVAKVLIGPCVLEKDIHGRLEWYDAFDSITADVIRYTDLPQPPEE